MNRTQQRILTLLIEHKMLTYADLKRHMKTDIDRALVGLKSSGQVVQQAGYYRIPGSKLPTIGPNGQEEMF